MNIISFFLTLQAQLKILHWQTSSYSRHMAYGDTYEDIDELSDDFIEAYQGKYGRIKAEDSLSVKNIGAEDLNAMITGSIQTLFELDSTLKESDSDLKGIRDEMVAKLNKLRYLLTLD